MQTDVAVVGGGLSGLTCAVALARRGKRVVLITGGNPMLEQFSGSIGVLGTIGGSDVTDDFGKAAKRLDKEHPYRRIGIDRARAAVPKASELFSYIGLRMSGNGKTNHWRLSPLGIVVPAWLSLDGYATLETPEAWRGKRLALMTVPGYLDQAPQLVAHNLQALGTQVTQHRLSLPQLQVTTPTPRPVTLSRKLDGRTALSSLANDINTAGKDADMVLMPAIMGDDEAALAALRRRVTVNMMLMPTLPPTTAGNHLNATLQHYLKMLGGYVATSQTVTSATIDGDRVTSLSTGSGFEVTPQRVILATGHLAGGGLKATPVDGVIEPVLGLDVSRPHPDVPEDFATTGVITQGDLVPTINGKPLRNVLAIGSLLGGHDAATMHDGEGVDMVTAIHAAELVCSK